MKFIETLINGLSIGGVYAMIALGYTMVYGIAKLLNFAHGEIIMIGGFTIILLISSVNPILTILLAIIVCVVLGITVEKVAYRPLRGASPLAVLITAIGVSNILKNVAALKYPGGEWVMFEIVDLGILSIGDSLKIKWTTIISIICTIVIMIALTLFIKYTRIGRAMVAVSEDNGASQLMGINSNFIIMITFAIGSALAAVAGTFMLLESPQFSSELGSIPGIKAFTAAVIGGIGSIPGAMIGGVLLGVIECLVKLTPADNFVDAIQFSLLIIMLLIKPTGILGKKRREKV